MPAPPTASDLTSDVTGARHQRLVRRRELQRMRRAKPGYKDSQNSAERKRYAALPDDHPRKNRRDRHTKESYQRKRKKELEALPDYVIATRYLHMKTADCPPELIGLKREVIRLNRMLGIQPKTI